MIHEIGHLVSIHQSGSGVLVDTLQDLVKRTLNESIAQGLKTSKNFDITILMPMMTAVPQISYGRNQLQGGGGGGRPHQYQHEQPHRHRHEEPH